MYKVLLYPFIPSLFFLYFCIIGLREELIALGMRAFILV
jgi:hypothetical protein